MNYERIYRAFIADRRTKEPGAEEYAERHHILPRCMGGGGEPENLIRLTPEDHFFAHLLLAKMHGGRLWAPVAFMAGGARKDYRPIQSRGWYGWATRALARSISGENAYQYDRIVYTLEHKDGRKWAGTQAEMHGALGLGRPFANLLVERKVGSAHGWFHEGERPKQFGPGGLAGMDHPAADRKVHHFVHTSGAEFVGTRVEFCQAHGVSKKSVCMMLQGTQVLSKGWHLKGATLPRLGGAMRKSNWRSLSDDASARKYSVG